MSDSEKSVVKVEVWNSYDFNQEPDDILEIELGGSHILDPDPHHHGRYGFRVSNDTRPVTLNIFTNDSVREPTMNRPSPQWDGPVERGLEYNDNIEHEPFGVELWGRVMLHIESEQK